jgi:hypothetical protein
VRLVAHKSQKCPARRERKVGVRCHSTWRFPKPVTGGLAKKSDTEVISFLSAFLAIVGRSPALRLEPAQVLQNPRIRGVGMAHRGVRQPEAAPGLGVVR